MQHTAGVVIVGASLGGLTTAASLRAEGYQDRITLIGAEHHPPYSRPPLSKQVLTGAWDATAVALTDPATLDVRFLAGARASRLDLAARAVEVAGTAVAYDQLVVATGAQPRRIPGTQGRANVHVLRTLDDALAVRQGFAGARHVTVVGAGVLGCEIASAARATGHEVTVIGRHLRFGRLGELLSPGISRLLTGHGVELRLGLEVAGFDGDRLVTGVQLSDGSAVRTDLVVVAIGCTPAVDWLQGSGLEVSDGVLCDARGVAAPGVHAVGDVARWLDPVTRTAERVEHQTAAIEQAHAVAHLVATGEPGAPVVPFFWSELFGTRILVCGRPDPAEPLTVLTGDPAEGRFVAATLRDGETVGLVGWNSPREFRQQRAKLLPARPAPPEGVLVR